MSKPIVAVVGRPNVGKSTLFNKLCGQRLAIVEDTPGITRDRIFANCEWSGHEFMLVDTGGIEPKATEGILAHMREQAEIAIDTADCIIMVVDVRDGLTAADEEVAHMLRRSHKPIILAVNKCDKTGEAPMELYEFYNLGFDEVLPISSVHGHGTGDLLDAVCAHLDFSETVVEEDRIPVAIIGRPNVGKSSLINRLCNRKNLARVSATPGKTATINFYRVDTAYFVDLPGYGYAKVSNADRERWDELINSYFEADRALNVLVQLLDSRHAPSADDVQMMEYLHFHRIPFVVALTKADKLKKSEMTAQLEEFRITCAPYGCKQVFLTSAEKGTGVEELRQYLDACLAPGA